MLHRAQEQGRSERPEHQTGSRSLQHGRRMIAPIDAERMGPGGAGHLHVVARVADEHRIGRDGAGRVHGAAQHFGMGLGGRIIRRLQRHEIVAKAMGFEGMGETALRLAGGDAEHGIVAGGERIQRLANAREERFDQILPPAELEEGALVALGDAGAQRGIDIRHERMDRLGKRQPDDGQHFLARQVLEAMRVEGMVHRRDDHVLTVDQRAVAIENDEAEGRGHSSSPAKASFASRSSKPRSFQLAFMCGGSSASRKRRPPSGCAMSRERAWR